MPNWVNDVVSATVRFFRGRGGWCNTFVIQVYAASEEAAPGIGAFASDEALAEAAKNWAKWGRSLGRLRLRLRPRSREELVEPFDFALCGRDASDMSLAMSRNTAAWLFVIAAGAALWLIMAWPSAPAAETRAGESAAGAAAEPVMLAPPPTAAGQHQAGSEALPPPRTAPAPAAPAAPAPVASSHELPELIQGDQGPVAEYRRIFESEPRSSSAGELEDQIRSAFPASDGAPDMFKSVLCRQTICRIEMRWSQDRRKAWMVGLSRLGRYPYKNAGFQTPLALSPLDPPNKQGTRLVEVYMKRRPPGSEPPH
jgi:hypothetical protein